MPNLPLVQPRLAPRLARRFSPTIIQEVKSVFDFIVPIDKGPLQPAQIERPTLYYAIHADETKYYALYAVFHRLDWSELPWPIKVLDEHQFDLEGILRVFDIKTGRALYCASIFHHEILFHMSPDPAFAFRIEAAGHGIVVPGVERGALNRSNMAMRYPFPGGCGELVSIPDNMEAWREYEPIFNAHGVHCPWQWNDHRIAEKYGTTTNGLIYHNPSRLFELAQDMGLL